MAPKFDKISVISTLIILALMAIPGVLAWQSETLGQNSYLTDNSRREVIPEFQEDSRILDRRILLRKDKGIVVNNSRLVFKGVQDKKIRLDVTLLELDPAYAYPHYIPAARSQAPFRLGDTKFEVLKVSRGLVQLKIVDLFQS